MTREKWGLNLVFVGLSLVAIGLPLSKVLMSSGQGLAALGWIVYPQLSQRVKHLVFSIPWWLSVSLFLGLLGGLVHTENFLQAANTIKIHLPLFVLPTLLASGPVIDQNQRKKLFLLFCAAVTVASLYSTAIYLNITPIRYDDIREISRFVSHIRFALMTVLSVVLLIWFSRSHPVKYQAWLMNLVAVWLIVFLFILKSLTGIGTLLIIALVQAFRTIYSGESRWRPLLIGLVVVLITGVSGYIFIQIRSFYAVEKIDFSALETHSSEGEPYDHNIYSKRIENGHYVWLYIARGELETEWNKRSDLSFDGNDQKGQLLFTTLTRYLTSRGLRKDGPGLAQLTEEEIRAVESGCANYRFTGAPSLEIRLYKIIWEFNNYLSGDSPTGNSVTQRLEFWRTALHIIAAQPLVGVGTGDLMDSMNSMYEKLETTLHREHRLEPHNLFISYSVMLGAAGLLLGIISITGAGLQTGKMKHPVFKIFTLIILLSCLTEDTFFTQAGVTFFAFFHGMFVWTKED